MRNISLPVTAVVLVGLMAGVAIWAARAAPAGMMLPVHWNAGGQGDHLVPAREALFHPVAMAGIVSLLLAGLPFIEPLQNRLEGSRALLLAAWQGLMAVMATIEAVSVCAVLGHPLPGSTMLVTMGLLLMWIGNALPKSRPGFFVGIRTPWTLIDTDNWIATHRFGGRSLMLAGLVVVVAALAPLAADRRSALVLASVLIGALVPVAYSFLHWWKRSRT